MKDLISVIIPIYNSKNYVYDCIQSVLEQTYSDFELVLIDDGSDDGSWEICQRLEGRDGRIRLIHQDHRGVSAARNRGIEAAKGKYLFFLDSDDVIHSQLLEALYLMLEEENTGIATESRYYAEGGIFQKPKKWKREILSIQDRDYLDNDKAIDYRFFGSLDTTLYVIGGKMVRYEILGNIRFNERLTHGEDTLFLYQLIADGADVSVLKRDWYYYRVHAEGVSGIYSEETCRSKHAVNRYIRNQELKAGRVSNAIRWESIIHSAMIKWYLIGKKSHDNGLMEYVKNLATKETKLKIYSRLSIKKKINFFLLFNCYPLYQMIATVYKLRPVVYRTRIKTCRILFALYKILSAVYQIIFIYQFFTYARLDTGENK